MAISLATVGGKITAAFLNLIVGRVNRQGLTAIIPTSVTGTGVTVGAGGAITLAAATTASVNGCFTAEFDNYLIVSSDLTLAAAALLQLQIRSAGTTISANYAYGLNYNNGNTPTSLSQSAQSQIPLVLVAQATADFTILIKSPARTSATYLHVDSGTYSASPSALSGYAAYTTVASVDGFTLLNNNGATAQAMTGTLRIYGYNNN